MVEPDLTIPGDPRVWVVGDLMHVDQGGRPVPGVAPAAIQAGRRAGENVLGALRGEPGLPFRYRDKGSLATIGRAKAVAHIGRWKFGGFAAWLAWLLIHIVFLIGFRNRLLVLIQWAWSYVTWDRGARLITGLAPAEQRMGMADGDRQSLGESSRRNAAASAAGRAAEGGV
jgi:NADH dehydrogenase